MLPMVRKSWFMDSWSTLDPLQCIRGFDPPQNPYVRLNNIKNIQNYTKFAAFRGPCSNSPPKQSCDSSRVIVMVGSPPAPAAA